MPEKPELSRKDAVDEPGESVKFPGSHELKRPGNNLPLPLSSLIGRERERTEARQLLAERRLLTLTGPGGSGKTRLALAVAGDVAEEFEDGVWWVELAPISDPELVAQEVARVLMIKEQPGRSMTEALARDLAPTELLLIVHGEVRLVFPVEPEGFFVSELSVPTRATGYQQTYEVAA